MYSTDQGESSSQALLENRIRAIDKIPRRNKGCHGGVRDQIKAGVAIDLGRTHELLLLGRCGSARARNIETAGGFWYWRNCDRLWRREENWSLFLWGLPGVLHWVRRSGPRRVESVIIVRFVVKRPPCVRGSP